MNAPRFSIVVPLYNKETEIRRALRSVVSQSVRDFEVLVINDGSTDTSRAAAEGVTDPRIRILDQSNAGESAARNRGIVEASGGLVAFLDGDDEWTPSFLATITRLTHLFPEAGAFSAGYSVTGSGITNSVPKRGVPRHPWEGILPDYFRTRNVVSSSSIVVRRDVFSTAGLFRVGLRFGADLDMWFRIAARYPIAYSTHFGAVVHARPVTSSSNIVEPTIESFLDESLAEIDLACDIPVSLKRRTREYVATKDLARALALVSCGRRADASEALSRWHRSNGVTIKWLLCRLATFLPEGAANALAVCRSFGIRAVLRTLLLMSASPPTTRTSRNAVGK